MSKIYNAIICFKIIKGRINKEGSKLTR